MQVAILSDTHVPAREPAVPDWVLAEVRAADHALHAGDFDAVETLETLREAATELTAVTGNVDPDLGLSAVETVELGGRTFVLTHGTGSAHDYEERVRETVRDNGGPGAVGVSGHSHQVHDLSLAGTRLLNPGSASGADPADAATMMRVEVAEGDLSVTVLEAGAPRS
jgi:putative phosphoesterase